MEPQAVIEQMMVAAIEAANPTTLVQNHLRQHPLDDAVSVVVVAVGKAAVAMACAAADILPPQTPGIVISKLDPATDAVQGLPASFQHVQAGHPVPDERSVIGTQAVKQLLAHTAPADLVLCLISGGASALLTDPQISLPQWRELNQALLHCGCTINEINHVRQHVDAVKGGGLLRWAAPARVKTLILSDVIGNNVAHIGSGPTVPTARDVAQVWRIFDRFNVLELVSAATRAAIEQHLAALSTDNATVGTAQNLIIGDVRKSLAAAAQIAQTAKLDVQIVSAELMGEAQMVAQQLARQLLDMPRGSCYLYGGETTVTIAGAPHDLGVGGRNQELALAAALALDGHANCWLATLATDGEDGPNDGAGGIVNGDTVRQAASIGLNAAHFLERHDSYTFFKQLSQQHVRIGPTGTNVNDITILMRL